MSKDLSPQRERECVCACVCVRVHLALPGPSPVLKHTHTHKYTLSVYVCVSEHNWACLRVFVLPHLLPSSVRLNLACLSLFYESAKHTHTHTHTHTHAELNGHKGQVQPLRRQCWHNFHSDKKSIQICPFHFSTLCQPGKHQCYGLSLSQEGIMKGPTDTGLLGWWYQ